jgi:hypothetical protein
MGNGAVLYSGTGDNTWQPVTPMSINHALWQAACPEGKSTEVARLLSRFTIYLSGTNFNVMR